MRGSRLCLVLCALLCAGWNLRLGDENHYLYLVKRAQAALDGERWEEAAQRYEEVMRYEPGRLDGYLGQVSALRGLAASAGPASGAGKAALERALARVEEGERLVLSGAATTRRLRRERAALYDELGRADEAIALTEELLAGSDDPALVLRLGGYLARRGRAASPGTAARQEPGDLERAAAAIERFLARRPAAMASQDPAARTQLATVYRRLGRHAEARRSAEGAVKARPGLRAAELELALAQAALGACDPAARTAAQLDPDRARHPELDLALARCELGRGRARPALERLDRHAGPRATPEVLALQAEARAALGDHAGALESLGALEATARSPEERVALSRRIAASLVALGRAAEAATRLEQAAAAAPAARGELTREAGEAWLRAGDAGRARALLERAGEPGKRPRDPRVAAALGMAHLVLGEAPKARAALEEARTARPDDAAVLRHLALAHLELGETDAAEQVAARALALAPDHPLALRVAARVALVREQPARAVPLLERALGRSTGAALAEAQLELGVAHARAGALEAARSSLAAGIRAAPAGGALGKTLRRQHGQVLARLAIAGAGAPSTIAALEAALAQADPPEALQLRCSLALSQLLAERPDAALATLRSAHGCTLPEPLEGLGGPWLAALAQLARATDGADAAEKELSAAARPSASDPAGRELARVGRAIAELRALAALRRSDDAATARAVKKLARDEGADASPELALAAAVADLRLGALDDAERAMRELAPTLPAAELDLALVHEARGETRKAYEALQRARRRGVAVPPRWLESKERLLGLGAGR